jgi:hypothetical protein
MKNLSLKNAVRDWKIMVSVFAFCLVALSGFAWQIYLSDKIGGGYLAPATEAPADSVNVVDQKKLGASLSTLQIKQANYIKLKAEHPRSVDPSL